MKKLTFALTVTSGAAALLTQHDADASTQHTVQSGESLWSISQQYNMSVDEIKQVNNLTSNMVFPGQVLTIGGGGGAADQSTQSTTTTATATAPSLGETHVVQTGETLDIIAANYGVTPQDIINANNLNGYLVAPSQTLTIPSGSDNTTAPSIDAGPNGAENAPSTSGSGSPTFNHQNLYDWGQCTWHVFNRRAETGQPISTYWYNAENWADNAAGDGYTVDHNPSAGSIMQTYEGPVGHVAYVERVNSDGSILVSEMNYSTPPGEVGYRTIPASVASSYNYIH